MKLLLDENLSPRRVPRLVELYGEIVHIRDVGLQKADDQTIWAWAKEHGHSIVTADADFVALSQQLRFPPKVIHLEQCIFPTAEHRYQRQLSLLPHQPKFSLLL